MKGLSRVCRIDCKYATFMTTNKSKLKDIMDEVFPKIQKKRSQPFVLEGFEQHWSFIS